MRCGRSDRALRRTYLQIKLELDTDELNVDLLQRPTDIAIRIGAHRVLA